MAIQMRISLLPSPHTSLKRDAATGAFVAALAVMLAVTGCEGSDTGALDIIDSGTPGGSPVTKSAKVDDLNLTHYIPAPHYGETPVLSFTGEQYSGNITWTKTENGGSFAGTFDSEAAYTATAKLKALPGRTFENALSSKNFFTHAGVAIGPKSAGTPVASLLANEGVAWSAGSASDSEEEGEEAPKLDHYYNKGTGIVTLVLTFGKTGGTPAQPVTAMNLSAITAPVAGNTPEKLFSVEQFNGEYWASVAWWPSPSGGRFANKTEYKATVTLTAVSGYTFTGIPVKQSAAEGFTHNAVTTDNGSISHGAGTGSVMTVVINFPKAGQTAPEPEEPEPDQPGQSLSAITFASGDNSVIDQIKAAKTAGSASVTITMETEDETETVQFGVEDLLAAGLVLTTDTSPASVTIDGGGYTVDLTGSPSDNPLITVRNGVTLTLKNITFKGLKSEDDSDTADNTRALIRVDTGGHLVLEAGAVIRDNNNISGPSDSDNWGGGVRVDGGTLTMKGGTISYNTVAMDGGGVCIWKSGTEQGMFTMSGGTIANNNAGNSGGGVMVVMATFTMSGGTIANNNADNSGGGVMMVVMATFTMSGGTIESNESHWAGGVFVGYDGTFTMNNGTISGNHGESGGGVCVYYNSAFTMNNGTISGNTATYGGGVCVIDGSKFYMSGGTISGNTAMGFGGGVAVSEAGTFTKTDTDGDSGTIYGSNAAVNLKNTANYNDPNGHAVYVSDNKYRDSTAGPGVDLDSSNGTNWES